MSRFSVSYEPDGEGRKTKVVDVLDEKTRDRYDLRLNSNARRFSALVNSLVDDGDGPVVYVAYRPKKSGNGTSVAHVATIVDGTDVKRFNLQLNSDNRNFIAEVNELVG